MRRNSSKPSHQRDEMLFGDFEDMLDDAFVEKFNASSSHKRDRRKYVARRQLERYREEKELAGWINDKHLDYSD